VQRDPAAPPVLDGYTAVRVLGLGGFSDVYLYEQELPRRRVAVKVLSGQVTDAVRSSFVREANLMAALSTHPYIVTVYQAGIAADGRPYLVMEYCSRPSLAERYKRQPLSVVDTLRTGIRIAGAVATLHGAGILHRDIKPANVLTNDYGWPALTDFGIATAFERGGAGTPGLGFATDKDGRAIPGGAALGALGAGGDGAGGDGAGRDAAHGDGAGGDGAHGDGADGSGSGGDGADGSGSGGSGAGGSGARAPRGGLEGDGNDDSDGEGDGGTIGLSVPWSPPEMFVDVPDPDVRSDVFSLAATLFTVLAGRTPFEIRGGPNGQLDLITRIERGEVTPMSRTDVPVSLLAALARGMAPRREDRWPDALEFAHALQRVELELGYAPTGIEVPAVDGGLGRAIVDDDEDDEDATRMRGMPTVIPQWSPPSAPAPAGGPGAGAARLDGSGPPAAPPNGPGQHPAAPGIDRPTSAPSDRAIPARVVPVPTVATAPGPADPGDALDRARATQRPRRRGLIVAIVVGVLAILGIAAVVLAIVFGGVPARDPEGPTPSRTGEPAVGPVVPQPTDGAATVSADGTSVTFTWTNPRPRAGDVSYWARSETPDDRTATPDTRAVVTGIVPGSRVCIDVAIGRAGRNSAPERICTAP
jgi:serine/threonine protein kinase